MISSESIKDIIKTNEEFILNEITGIVPRKEIIEPSKKAFFLRFLPNFL